MTCVATTSPTLLPAAAPASTALLTAATSPRTIAVTRPASIFSQPTKRTFAALTIASAASIIATSPLHSTIPSASGIDASSVEPHGTLTNVCVVLRGSRIRSSVEIVDLNHCHLLNRITIFRDLAGHGLY